MRIALLLVLACCALATGSVADSVCDQAAFLFFNRHLNPCYLDSAYTLLARKRSLDPGDERCRYLWSRIHVQKGDDVRSKPEKMKLYERARSIAESLTTTNDKNPDGHMWWAVAQGRIGQQRGVMNSLFMVPSLKAAFSRVLELDSGYATAYDAFGVLYYELPGIVGGNLKKSEEFLVKGLRVDPNYTILRLDLTKVYIKQKRWAEAKNQLQELIATPKPTIPADFVLDDKPEAEELLRQLKDR